MAIAGATPNALAGMRISFVQHDPERSVKRPEALAAEVFAQLLHAGLVADCRVRIGSAGRRLGWVFTTLAVDVVYMLSFRIVGFELVVRDGPGGRHTSVVLDLAEVLLGRGMDFRLLPDRVTRLVARPRFHGPREADPELSALGLQCWTRRLRKDSWCRSAEDRT